MASNKGQSSCVAYLWISFLVVGIVPGVVSNVELTSIPSSVEQICPRETIEFTCITESSRLLWTSDEYIGVGSQFEFRIIDPIGTTDTNAATIANLSDINGGVLTSTLRIVTSQSSTITCINGDDRTTATSLILVAAVPGAPQNVMAVGSMDDCMIQVTWNPPADTGGSDYTYRVNVSSRNIMVNTNSSTESILHVPDCADDIPIQVYAVNRFDCMRSAETLLRLQSGSTTTAPSGLSPGAAAGIAIAIACVIIAFVVVIVVVICCYEWKVKKQKQQRHERQERMRRENDARLERQERMRRENDARLERQERMRRENDARLEEMEEENRVLWQEQEEMEEEITVLEEEQEETKEENRVLRQEQEIMRRKNMALQQEQWMTELENIALQREQQKMELKNRALQLENFVSHLSDLYDALIQKRKIQEAVHQLLRSMKKISPTDVQEALKTVLKTKFTSAEDIGNALVQLKLTIPAVIREFDAKLEERSSITVSNLMTAARNEKHKEPLDELKKQVDKASPEDIKDHLQELFEALANSKRESNESRAQRLVDERRTSTSAPVTIYRPQRAPDPGHPVDGLHIIYENTNQEAVAVTVEDTF